MTKPFLVVIIACAFFSCSSNRKSVQDNIPIQDVFLPPKVTILANLPDSLQPKIVALDTMPAPSTIAVPTKTGSSNFVALADGQKRKINLEPPVIKELAVLRDLKGDPIKDSFGNTFVMGDGGGLSHFTTFSTDDGLALDGVDCSKMDKLGNLWFGTEGGGVSRYDGKCFTNFSAVHGLSNNTVFRIWEDRKGNMWFGTDGGGVSRYDGHNFTTFTTADGLGSNVITDITEDKAGNLWFGSALNGGLSRYNGKNFTTFSAGQGLPNNAVLSVYADEAGAVWVGTDGGGVSSFNGNSFSTLSTEDGLASNRVYCILKDKAGKLWFSTIGSGVCRFDPTANKGPDSKSFTTFSTTHGLASTSLYSVCEDRTGNVWFGSNGNGVSCYNPHKTSETSTKSFTTFSVGQGLANSSVLSICEDKSGNLWFGTLGGGVSRYNGKAFTNFSTTDGLANNQVISMAEDKDGNLWCGTVEGGVCRYDGKSFSSFSVAQGLPNNTVKSIFEDKAGNLWFGTRGAGVSRYGRADNRITASKSFTTYSTTQGLANNEVLSICDDDRGNLWFGTFGGGVSCYHAEEIGGKRKASFTTFTAAQGLGSDIVYCIFNDKAGNLWFGCDGGGATLYDGKSFINLTADQGLADNTVYNIFEDKTGNLWFGTAGGVSVIGKKDLESLFANVKKEVLARGKSPSKVGSSNPVKFIKTFNTTDGLPDNFVTQVIQLPDGKIAVGSNKGIALFTASADFAKLNDIEIYNSNTGFPVKDVNTGQGSMYLDSKGIVWVGTGSDKTALVRFDPSAVLRSKEPPTLVIKGVKINESAICWNDIKTAEPESKTDSHATPAYVTEEITTLGRVLSEQERDSVRRWFGSIGFDSIRRFYPVPDGLVLPYALNHVTIDFNAIETGKPQLVKYQHMLVGYDKDWSPISKTTSATYGNIKEGNYTFKVKAQSPDGVWCAPVTYKFKVLPPWYRTWWAYSIYCLLFLLALRIFSKWRERKLRMENEKLEKTVQERTAVVEQQKGELLQKNIVVEQQKSVAESEKQRSDELLLNILPGEVADELKANGTSAAKHFDNVTVLFTDFVGFSTASERMTPQELVNELHACFQAFDVIMGKYNIEKIKTVGDAYLAVCGLPQPATNHAENVIKAALEIRNFMAGRYAALGNKTFQIRIGVHSGSLVAGIVGVKKFAYDVWGDTVNTAARMEQNSEPGRINISAATYELVKSQFQCEFRGEIAAKNKGMLKMYFVG